MIIMRTLVDIPDEDIQRLDQLAAGAKRSRAAEIRDAIREHLRSRSTNDWIYQGAGYWEGRADIGDAVAYQRTMREDRTAYDDL